jgi:biopolymer transport protein ExbD
MDKSSRRTRRMERHYKRNNQGATLNMVSMMDIFTILLFFLLMNAAADSEILSPPKQIVLPESITDKGPKENIVIMVNSKEITIDNQVVARTADVLQTKELLIPGVLTALQQQADKARAKRIDNKEFLKRGITIMGDKQIPYDVLKKIMLTCASMDFANISLAVMQKSQEKG